MGINDERKYAMPLKPGKGQFRLEQELVQSEGQDKELGSPLTCYQQRQVV